MSDLLAPIGRISTPFPEKFGVPRQPGLAEATGVISLEPEFNQPGVFEGLEGISHLWLLFLFHDQPAGWSARVRPPRLGGNRKVGVFATRSPRRPNPIGLSVVRLLSVDAKNNVLEVGGVDMVDGTPLLDIKPYLPYADAVAEASHPFASSAPARRSVNFERPAAEALSPQQRELVSQVLGLDPRPAYHADSRTYGTIIAGFNVRWRMDEEGVRVSEVQDVRGADASR